MKRESSGKKLNPCPVKHFTTHGQMASWGGHDCLIVGFRRSQILSDAAPLNLTIIWWTHSEAWSHTDGWLTTHVEASFTYVHMRARMSVAVLGNVDDRWGRDANIEMPHRADLAQLRLRDPPLFCWKGQFNRLTGSQHWIQIVLKVKRRIVEYL